MGVADDEIGENHLQSACADGFAERIIIGKLVLDGFETADGPEHAAPQRDGRPDAGPRHVQGQPGQDIGQEAVIHPHSAEPRPESRKRAAAIKTGDDSDAGTLQRRRQPVEIIRRDHDVAVGQHDELILDAPRQVDQVGDLAIGSMQRGIDDQLHAQPGRRALDPAGARRRDDAPRDRGRRIVGLMDAQQDLHRAGIVLAAEAQQVFVEALLQRRRVASAPSRREISRALSRLRPLEAAHADESQQGIEARGDSKDEERRRDRRRSDQVRQIAP